MDEWILLGKPLHDASGNGYWVGDYDGWFYWSKALMPTDATGLLLDGIKLIKEPENESYYGIHVTSQMASKGDWGDKEAGSGFYEHGLTPEGEELLNRAAGMTPSVRSIKITNGSRVYVREGESINLYADLKLDNPSGDPGEQMVTWSADDPSANLGTRGLLTTSLGDAGKVYTITATSIEMPEALTDSTKVYVYDVNAAGVAGPQSDRNYYLDWGDNTFQEINEDGTLEDLRCAGRDTTIGNQDDILEVLVNKDGTKLLDNGDGSYFIKGPDNLLGTDDDIRVWPNPTIDNLVTYDPTEADYDLILTQVGGSGNGTNQVKQGGNIQYTAQLNVTSEDPDIPAGNQAVKWELTGGKAGTTLSTTDYTTDGLINLNIAADEALGTDLLTLKATTQEGSISKTVKLTVTASTYGVTITQTGATGNSVKQGGTLTYTAGVTILSTNPATPAGDQAVKWEIVGTHKTGTTLSTTDYTTGAITLTVAADEAVGTNYLILRATSREGGAQQTVTISTTPRAYATTITQKGATGNTVKQGESVSYTAGVKVTSVTPNYNAVDQAVKWEITSTHKTGTTLSTAAYTTAGITVTVAADETIGTLTLRAISREGGAQQTVNISVTSSGPAAEVDNGETFKDDKGVEWQVLTTDSNGYKLIMTTSENTRVPYDASDLWVRYNASTLMTTLTNFYNNNVGSDVKAAAVPVTISDLRNAAEDPVAFNSNENATTRPEDISKAGSGTPTAANAIFILSIAECNTYKSNITSSSSLSNYWLRTVGVRPNVPTYSYYGNYITGMDGATGLSGYRPALWIKS